MKEKKEKKNRKIKFEQQKEQTIFDLKEFSFIGKTKLRSNKKL